MMEATDERTEVVITVGDPWNEPWKLTLHRPGHEPYKAECIVVRSERSRGPHFELRWDTRHSSEIVALLMVGLTSRLRAALAAEGIELDEDFE